MYSYPTACEDVPHRNAGVADSVPVLVAGAPPPPVLDVTPALPWWRFESSNVNRITPPDAGGHDSLPEVVALITSQVWCLFDLPGLVVNVFSLCSRLLFH